MEDGQEVENNNLPFYGDHRFLAMIILSIIIATVLVSISITIYYTDGAAQLDLSRPGYKEVRSKVVDNDDSFSDFSASGSISKTVIGDFRTLYNQQATKAKAIDAFGSDPLNPNVLWVTTDSQQ